MAIQNEVQNAELGYILCPFESYTSINGKPLVGGWICIYLAGTDTKYISFQDFDGSVNPFKIPIPLDGRIVALGDPSLTYDVYLYNSFGDLVCSRLNIQCNVPGEINLSGVDTYVRNTDGTLDVSLQTSGNNRRVFTVNTKNKLLDVQEPLYFVENSETATIIGFDESGNYATTAYVGDAIASSISSKVDITAFNEEITNITNNITALSADVDGKMDVSKLEYNSHDEISGYDGTAFAGGQGDPEVNDLVHANSAAWNEVSAKLDATAFNPNEFYPSTNPSGFINKTSADELYQPKGNYASATDLTAYQTIEGMTAYQPSGDYATHDDLTAYQPSGDYATHDDLTAYQTVDGMSAYQPSGDYATHDDLTAYQPSGDYAYASAVSAAITGSQTGALQISGGWDNGLHIDGGGSVYIGPGGRISAIGGATLNLIEGAQLNLAQGAKVSANAQAGLTGTDSGWSANDFVTTGGIKLSDMTAYQPASGMTAYQPTGDYATHDDLTAYATTSLVSSVSSELYSAISGISGTYELSAGSGIDITDYPNEQKTVISVTAQGPNTEVEAEVIAHSADWNTVTAKADSDDLTAYQTIADMTAYQPVGDYYSASNPDGFLVADDITGKMDTSAMTAYQPAGEYLSANALDNLSGTWETVTAKANADDLTAYQTIEGMTAYQPSGDYQPAGEYLSANALDNVSADWNEVSAKLDTTAFSDVSGSFLTAHQDISNKLDTTAFSDVSGSFLTAVPDTYLQNTDLETADGKVTAISGIPLSAGGDVPEGVMVESGLEYNAVNEISGYNGSAIAQYGAEKQWLVHDDTLVHAANSAQYALGVNLSAVAQLLGGIDETVLYDGESSGGILFNNNIPLSESYKNFNTIKIMNGHYSVGEFPSDLLSGHQDAKIMIGFQDASTAQPVAFGLLKYSATNDTSLIQYFNRVVSFTTANAVNVQSNASNYNTRTFKVIGIGRKQ